MFLRSCDVLITDQPKRAVARPYLFTATSLRTSHLTLITHTTS